MLRALTSRWPGPVVLVFLVGVAYFAWRSPGQFVWDDSPMLSANEYPEPGVALDPLTPHLSNAWLYGAEFRRTQPDGYRPLSWMMRRIGQAAHATAPEGTRVGLLLLNGLVAGLTALAHYRLARRFTTFPLTAGFTVFLLLASMPVLTGFLVLFAGIQGLVLLLICVCLNSYYCYLDNPNSPRWLLVIGLVLFFGSWYREFVGLTAILLIFLEGQQRRWRSPVVIVALVGFAHAVFPTALLHLAFPELPLRPVWRLGALKDQIEFTVANNPGAWIDLWGALQGLQWRIFLDLLNILPPTLLLLAAAGWAVCGVRGRPGTPTGGPFLAVFFAVTFLPFLVVFKEQVHLAYALLPATILLACGIERLWQFGGARLLRAGVAAVLLVGCADHALNPLVVRSFTRRSQAVVSRLVRRMAAEMPPGAAVVANAHHACEVRRLSSGRLSCYYSAMSGGNVPLLVPSPAALQQLINRFGHTGVYCLDARLPSTEDQPGCDRIHWIVRDRVVDLLHYGEVARLSFRYPVLDPLKWLLPTRITSFPGSPDLEFDYYRGPALDGARGWREVAVNYHLYKVADRTVRPGPPRPVYLLDHLARQGPPAPDGDGAP